MENTIFISVTVEELKRIINEVVTPLLSKSPSPRYYTRKEVADLLRVSLPTIHNLVNAGKLQPLKINGRTLFSAEEIESAIEEKKIIRYGRK